MKILISAGCPLYGYPLIIPFKGFCKKYNIHSFLSTFLFLKSTAILSTLEFLDTFAVGCLVFITCFVQIKMRVRTFFHKTYSKLKVNC